MSNPRLRTALGTLAVAALAPIADAQLKLSAERISPMSSLFASSPPGDHHRLFTVSQVGQISIIKDGVLLPPYFLNLQSTVLFAGESGLLGLAFHPQFAQNGYCYVYYSTSTNVVVARYTVDPANPDRADPASALPILKIARSFGGHYAGWMSFGPDGDLYIASGNADLGGNSSSTSTLLGKILRIDVDRDDFPADPNRNYGIPLTNPFLNTAGAAPEIWAYGLRNPWRCSFDRFTGDLWIGDVGDSLREEINFQPAVAPPFTARNYGYPCMEGTLCSSSAACTCGQPGLTLPILEYSHALGFGVIGGYVYRGGRIAELQGAYLFGDIALGNRWTLRRTESGPSVVNTVEIGGLPTSANSFGEDADGELYVCTPTGLYRLLPHCPANCDNSAVPPILNVNDFQCFLNKFAAGDSYANCDGSTLPPILNVNDFACYLNLFAAGCT